MPNTVISIKHLTKIYKLYDRPIDRLKESLHPLKKQYHKEFFALNDVSFEIKRGETVGIIGKNGAGKSTLLKIITGVLTPTSGSVHVHGRIASLLELGAGFNPEYTGVENIYFQGSLMGYTREEMESKIDDILAFADIGDFVHQSVKMYSSGMFARLAFAVAINVDPDILIVDEALSVGDAAFQRKCFARMETIRNNGTTIVFVSHSEGQIVELCSRAIFVHGGQIVLDGEPKKVTTFYMKLIHSASLTLDEIKEEFQTYTSTSEEKAPLKTLTLNNSNQPEDDFEEFFDPSLLPTSSIDYQKQEVEIFDVKITTINGNKVNVLQSGKNYIFAYKVKFLEEKYNITFGMGINLSTGLNIAGGNFPGIFSSMKKINANEQILLNWQFTCNLDTGVYFNQCGILSEGIFLHRVVDAYAFKVVPKKNSFDTGFVNMILTPSIKYQKENLYE